jgi:hypothetical protein
MRNLSRDLFEPGSGMEKFESGIRYKHPGSGTLLLLYPYISQKWKLFKFFNRYVPYWYRKQFESIDKEFKYRQIT